MKVVFLRSAEADLKDLRGYVTRNFGRDAWNDTYARVRSSVAMISSGTSDGNIPHEFRELGIVRCRQVISGSNRIIYEIRDDIVYILVVCDTRRDLKGLLMRRMVEQN